MDPPRTAKTSSPTWGPRFVARAMSTTSASDASHTAPRMRRRIVIAIEVLKDGTCRGKAPARPCWPSRRFKRLLRVARGLLGVEREGRGGRRALVGVARPGRERDPEAERLVGRGRQGPVARLGAGGRVAEARPARPEGGGREHGRAVEVVTGRPGGRDVDGLDREGQDIAQEPWCPGSCSLSTGRSGAGRCHRSRRRRHP